MNLSLTNRLALLLAATLGLTSANALAAEMYAGAKAGFMIADVENQDTALNIGGLFGMRIHEFPDKYGTLSAEGEITVTMLDADRPGGGDWDVDTLAAYAVYRSPGDTFLKVKGGVMWLDTNYASSITELSMGIGVGFRMGKTTTLEVEYTTVDDNIDMFSVGVNFKF